MGIELIRKAVCDRCGKECYHITEKTINQNVCEQYKIERRRIVENTYHYTEMALTSYDSRFETGEPMKIVLCGSCINDLGEWLKLNRQNDEVRE